MALSIKVKNVRPLDDLWLHLTFENQQQKFYDVKQLIPQFPVFEDLYNESLFRLVCVDCGGYAIAWNSEIDISECELWENGVTEEVYRAKMSMIEA